MRKTDEAIIAHKKAQKEKERFWAKVNKTDDCWLWTGCTDSHGYANFYKRGANGIGSSIRAHRFLYETTNNIKLNPWQAVRRNCNNRICLRPDHLRVDELKVHKTPEEYLKNRQTGPRPRMWKHKADTVEEGLLLQHMNRAYLVMKAQAKFRQESFELTFDDYKEAWGEHYIKRGRTENSLNLTRINDKEAWKPDNLKLIKRVLNLTTVRQENLKQQQQRKKSKVLDFLNKIKLIT